MKPTKHRGYAGSIRTVWNDDRTAHFGMVGTVQDFLEASILDYCDAPGVYWIYIPCLEGGQPGTLEFHQDQDGALAAARAAVERG